MDQAELGVDFTVEARTVGNTKTSNYASPGYGFLGTVSVVAEDSDDGVDLSSRFTMGTSPSWSAGGYVNSSTTAAFLREGAGSLDGPFDDLQLGIKVQSHASDPSAELDGLDMNAATAGLCATCDAQKIGGATRVRFGRMALQSAFGSELIALPMAFTAEYYDGDGFTAHAQDACTSLTLADHLRLSNPVTAGGTLQTGDTAMTVGGGSSSITNLNSPLIAGEAGLIFSAPGEGNTGDIELQGNIDCSDATVACVSTDTFPYLLYDWDNDGVHDDNPTANASFGIFSRSDNIIDTREPW
jgi:MSHA biogenesis protein MshQ